MDRRKNDVTCGISRKSPGNGGGRASRRGRGAVTGLVIFIGQCGQVSLSVKSRSTTRSGRGNRLPVLVIDDIAAGEDTGNAGAPGSTVYRHVTGLVQRHLIGE